MIHSISDAYLLCLYIWSYFWHILEGPVETELKFSFAPRGYDYTPDIENTSSQAYKNVTTLFIPYVGLFLLKTLMKGVIKILKFNIIQKMILKKTFKKQVYSLMQVHKHRLFESMYFFRKIN